MRDRLLHFWENPPPWVSTLAQSMVAQLVGGPEHTGNVTTCSHHPEIALTPGATSSRPAVYDADTEVLRCLACYSLAWGQSTADTGRGCVRCGSPGEWHIAPVDPYPSVRITLTVCATHGPEGGPW